MMMKYAKEILKFAELTRSANKLVFVVGAGISTPSGVPDFRSDSGLYKIVTEKLGLAKPETIFDLEYFKHDPSKFYKIAKLLYPKNIQPNLIHDGLKRMQDDNRLLRVYTQNIDGLELKAGVHPDNLVQAHGSFTTATCLKCRKKYDSQDIETNIENETVPKCVKCGNVIKPDVTFFGEFLPTEFMKCYEDMEKTDGLVVMGTSLQVYPFSGIVNRPSETVPRLLINNELVGSFASNKRVHDCVYVGDLLHGFKIYEKELNRI